MNTSKALDTTKARMWRLLCVALLLSAASAHAQMFEVTPLVGGRFGGTIKLQETGQPNRDASLEDSFSYGVSGGVRFDGGECEKCSVIAFRWMRQKTHLSPGSDFPDAASFRPNVTLDHFLADFMQEFPIRETRDIVRPFVSASLGAARMATPAESRTRFEFGIGGGIDIFPKPRWGFRVQVEYLPMVMNAELQRVICGAGGCIVAVSGGVMNQFQVLFGPIFRF